MSLRKRQLLADGESHYLIGTLSRLTQAYERATLQERVELGLQMRKKLVVLNDASPSDILLTRNILTFT